MRICSLDYETFSECDIKRGAARYSEDPSTEIICLAYTFDYDLESIKLWHPDLPPPQDFIDHIANGGLVRGWNCAFEYFITNNVGNRLHNWPKLKYNQILCTMSDALTLALPGSLAACGEAIGLPVDKQKSKEGVFLFKKIPEKKRTNNKMPIFRIYKIKEKIENE